MYVSLAEIAPILGVSKQRVWQLSKNANFPKPFLTTGSGRVWLRSDIEAYARTRNKKSGRPKC